MNEIRICKYCGMELSEDVPHGLRECHLRAVARIAELEAKNAEHENYIQELLDGDIKLLQAICKSEVDMAKYNELEVEYSKWILYDKIKLAEMIDWASMWEDYTRAAGKYRESKFPELDLDEMFSPLEEQEGE